MSGSTRGAGTAVTAGEVPQLKVVSGRPDNWADFFTKPLKPKHFTAMRNAIMNIDSGL